MEKLHATSTCVFFLKCTFDSGVARELDIVMCLVHVAPLGFKFASLPRSSFACSTSPAEARFFFNRWEGVFLIPFSIV